MALLDRIIEKSGCKTDTDFVAFLTDLQTNPQRAVEFANCLTEDERGLLAHAVISLRRE